MLRKISTDSAAFGRSGRSLDDNEKGSKIKRHKDSQTKAIFFCLGIIALLGVIAKVEVNHLHKVTSKRLRAPSRTLAKKKEAIVELPLAVDFLPPHSIYKLEVEDIYGKMVDFAKFRGMVTLIVNVACN